MTDKQILQKAIEKAEGNGYKYIVYWNPDGTISYKKQIELEISTGHYYRVIFDHSFARAFWKDHPVIWKNHLKHMVLEKEPLKYLEKFLENKTT